MIGSGATAISMIPSLADKAAQRHDAAAFADVHDVDRRGSTRLIAGHPKSDCRAKVSHAIRAASSCHRDGAQLLVARKAPTLQQTVGRGRGAVDICPTAIAVDTHFKPRYDPWDQRMCLMLDGDLYEQISAGPGRSGHRPRRPRRCHRHRAEVRRPPRRRRDHHRHRPAVAGPRRCRAEHRRRRGQAHRPVRLQGVPARGRPEHGVVHRLHQRVVDAAGRHDGTGGRRSCWPTWIPTATRMPTRTWATCP